MYIVHKPKLGSLWPYMEAHSRVDPQMHITTFLTDRILGNVYMDDSMLPIQVHVKLQSSPSTLLRASRSH